MLRAFKKIPKVLCGQVSQVTYSSTNSAGIPQAAPVLSGDPSNELSSRQPGHIRLFPWLPARGQYSFQECVHYILNQGQRCYSDQQNQWQSHRQQHSEFEAFGWGTAVVVAIQLCRALSVARVPDGESVPRPAFFRLARLLPVPPAARGVLPGGPSSQDSKLSGSSSSKDDSLQSRSSMWENSSSGDGVSQCSGEVEAPTPEGSHNSTAKDSIIHALEDAMTQLDRAHARTQAVVHTMMGIQYANSGSHQKAVEHFEAASQKGYSKAQFNLGLCFELGKGVEVDTYQAAYLYQQAAEQGHPLALYNLGVFCYHGYGGIPQDKSAGMKYIMEAAAAGVIQAHSFLGNHYLYAGNRDVHKAVFHLKRAAEEEDAESEYLLGVCYEQGWGVHKSRRRAATLYHRAAERGYPLAMYSLGLYYEKQLGGLLGDEEEAIRLYTSASKCGLQLATERLKSLTTPSDPGECPHSGVAVADTSEDNKLHPSEVQPVQQNSTFHTSASEPSLHDKGLETRPGGGNLLRLSYLSLILPSLLRATNRGQQSGVDSGGTQDGESIAYQEGVRFQVGGGGDEENHSSWLGGHGEGLQLIV